MALRLRHRVMIIGDSGTGKTRAALSFASEHLLEFPDAKIAIIDCDDSMDFEMSRYSDVYDRLEKDEAGETPYWFRIVRYSHLEQAALKVQQYLRTNDLLIFEGLERGWELAQDHYTQEVFGRTTVEHMQTLRQTAISTNKETAPTTFDSMRDWPSIRKLWKNEILIPITVATPWHTVATAAGKPIVNLNQAQDIWNVNPFLRAIFGNIGMAPEGEKSDVKRFDIAVVLGIRNNRDHIFSVAKNREKTGLRPQDNSWTNRPFWATLQVVTEPKKEEEESAEVGSAGTDTNAAG